MNWESLDWEVLDRLRETFLAGDKTGGPYWHTITDLECYDFTYGERIGWKWDAMLQELKRRGWSAPTGGTVLDWGCGSGIAGRRVVNFFGPQNFTRLQLHDHSDLAMDFAEHYGRKAFPGLPVDRATYRDLNGDEPIGLLVVSHVVNELTDIARAELTALCARAQAVLWVEPGTHEVSRLLGGWREQLRDQFQVIAPCPHQATCGVLTAGNERHWCHFFAPPPVGVYADSGWVRFGQRAGIDLRSLPYSFLVLERKTPVALGNPPIPAPSVMIGEARHYKGYAKIFNCDAGGVAELMLQKRDAPLLFKELKHGAGPSLHHWSHENGRITRIESP
ncbi:Mitochondrial small ribosomal subunit Rsm22 [Lacunisphaera limnophila]|uniref:Mitochondrial small ribosomal subunit Rsm22 n=1 Tax=Lacunisphaera limnophila TaxID=1838286 RepID=A0A1D8AXT9_9BACT|nr:small ribosomal subunit Rsm22 family protein [Lacunisphaera limnophila]AOS45709.1 Mitochondrial small ribosomal subunit Rsm22 [Lacunisphaera limnophila]